MAKTPPAPVRKSNPKLAIIFGVVAIVIIGGGVALAVGHKSNDMAGMNMSPSAAPANATATNAVTVANYAFSPAAITVKVGTKVTWTQTDAVSHTITSDSGKMINSDLLSRGQTYSYTFTTAGTYTYHCTPHPYMKGTVVVTN